MYNMIMNLNIPKLGVFKDMERKFRKEALKKSNFNKAFTLANFFLVQLFIS